MSEGSPFARQKRLRQECPVCGLQVAAGEGQPLQDLRSRYRGFVHGDCLEEVLPEMLALEEGAGGMAALAFVGPGLEGPGFPVRWILYDEGAEELDDVQPSPAEQERCLALWGAVSGRAVEEAYREVLVIGLGRPDEGRGGETEKTFERFAQLRRQVMRDALFRIS